MGTRNHVLNGRTSHTPPHYPANIMSTLSTASLTSGGLDQITPQHQVRPTSAPRPVLNVARDNALPRNSRATVHANMNSGMTDSFQDHTKLPTAFMGKLNGSPNYPQHGHAAVIPPHLNSAPASQSPSGSDMDNVSAGALRTLATPSIGLRAYLPVTTTSPLAQLLVCVTTRLPASSTPS
jgi:hypothetical protein